MGKQEYAKGEEGRASGEVGDYGYGGEFFEITHTDLCGSDTYRGTKCQADGEKVAFKAGLFHKHDAGKSNDGGYPDRCGVCAFVEHGDDDADPDGTGF